MIFEYIAGKQFVKYKKPFRVELNRHPLMVIRGVNKDAGHQPNGAGKTLAFAAIPTVVYSEPPLSDRKNSAKDYHRKGSELELGVTDRHNDRYVFKQSGTAASVKLEATRNDAPLKVRTKDSVRERIAKVVPQSQEAFYAFTYINVAKPNIIQSGSSPERYDFFESVWDLTIYDKVATYARKQASAAYEAKSQLDALKGQYRPVKFSKVKKLRSKVEKITDQHTKLQELMPPTKRIHDLESYLTLTRKVDRKMAALSNKVLKKRGRKLVKRVKELETGIREAHKIGAEYRQWKKNAIAHREAKAKLDAMGEVKPFDPDIYKGIYPSSEEDAYKWWKKATPEDEALLKNAPDKDPQRKVDRLVERALQIENILTHKHKGVECDHCGQSLKGKAYKRRLVELHQENKKLDDKLAYWQEKKECWDFKQGAPTVSREQAIHDWKKFKKMVAKLEKREKRWDKFCELRNEVKRLDPGQKPPKPQDTEAMQKEIDTLKPKLERLREENSRRKQIEALGLSDIQDREQASKELHELRDLIETTRVKLAKISEQLNELRSRYATLSERHKIATKMGAEIQDLTAKASKRKHWDAIAEAYGPDGMRIDAIRKLVNLYVDNLNRYAPHVYLEPFKFSAVVEKRRLSIIADRGGDASDIKYLSIAESHLFPLLSVAALLPLVPQKLRSNLLILDDFDNGMSKETRNHVISNYLPKLNKIVPNVVIITADSKEDFPIPNAKEMVVIRKNGKSIIKEAA